MRFMTKVFGVFLWGTVLDLHAFHDKGFWCVFLWDTVYIDLWHNSALMN